MRKRPDNFGSNEPIPFYGQAPAKTTLPNGHEMFAWLDAHKGHDVIRAVSEFREKFNLSQEEAYFVLGAWRAEGI